VSADPKDVVDWRRVDSALRLLRSLARDVRQQSTEQWLKDAMERMQAITEEANTITRSHLP